MNAKLFGWETVDFNIVKITDYRMRETFRIVKKDFHKALLGQAIAKVNAAYLKSGKMTKSITDQSKLIRRQIAELVK